MKTYQRVERVFQAFMLGISLVTLAATYELVRTREYSDGDLVIIGIFCFPVVLSALVSIYLLTQKVN
jgi:hypothetical protein